MPEALDPRRLEHVATAGPAERERILVEALEQSCAYGRDLWLELQRARMYLLERVARGSTGEGPGPVLAAHEPLLRNEQDWAPWADRYGAIFSALCGPRGDEGLGTREAVHEAQMHEHLLPYGPA